VVFRLRVSSLLAALLGISGLLYGCGGSNSTPSASTVLSSYVYMTAAGSNAVDIFAPDGTLARSISGPDTGLSNPFSLTVDPTGKLYVVNQPLGAHGFVTVYAPKASGDSAPLATIGGAELSSPNFVAVDSSAAVYVTNTCGEAACQSGVFVYNANAPAGPVRTIPWTTANIGAPEGIAVDSSGETYVVDAGPATGQVDVFAAAANGPTTPMRIIEDDSLNELRRPKGIALDRSDYLYVADSNTGIQVFSPGANGPAVPVRSVSGQFYAVAVSNSGALYALESAGAVLPAYSASVYGPKNAVIKTYGPVENGSLGLAIAPF